MKKQGFTLAEMVISITIVGAIAAVSIPLISNIIPDRKKIQVLKVHKLLTTINQDILSDPSLYLQTENCTGLGCRAKPLESNWTTVNDLKNCDSGDSKYLAILADRLKASEYSIVSDNPQGSFTTQDGIAWSFDKDNNVVELTIDIDSAGENCTHSSACASPDQFSFRVVESGLVFGADPLTITYLKNPHNLSDRNNDFHNSIKYAEELKKQAEEELKKEQEKAEAEKANTENSQ